MHLIARARAPVELAEAEVAVAASGRMPRGSARASALQ
jgi:hypothetical protein